MPRLKFDRSLIPPAPNLAFEEALWASGLAHLAGIDEAGRGALAGPVAAAAVILPANASGLAASLHGVRDSKELTPLQREACAARIRACAAAWAVGFASAPEIDAHGIIAATRLAIRRALLALPTLPDHLLVDALPLPEVAIPQTTLIEGDARSLSIAAASILAKTARDAHMRTLDTEHPEYGFARHKGYGTAAHLAALAAHGPCPIHRQTFASLGGNVAQI